MRYILILLVSLPLILNAQQNISGTVNRYAQVQQITPQTQSVQLNSSIDFQVGDLVLLIQMKGAKITQSQSDFGRIVNLNGAGNHELHRICRKTGNEVFFQNPILKSYQDSGAVQLIKVPEYHNGAMLSDTLSCESWNGSTGGVLVLKVQGTLDMNNRVIDVSGKGFQGGKALPSGGGCLFVSSSVLYTDSSSVNDRAMKGEGIANYIAGKECSRGALANGGGGGNNHNGGGSGGSNFGAGGIGGQRVKSSTFSCGSLAGTSAPDLSSEISQGRIFLGGGGGAGHGNNAGLIGESGMNGGGIFLLLADTLVSNGGLILADGNSAIVRAEGEGGGAGGAGGTVVLISNTVSGNLSISCQGGKGTSVDNIGSGNCSGPAGGGGGGAILYSTSSKPGGILANLDGGANGVITSSAQSGCNVGNKNGATSGGNGGEVLNYNITDQSVERPPTSSQITACNKYFSPSGKYVWTQSGNYIDTTLNVAGCDSILDISLTIVPVDTSVQQEGNTLTSLATGVNHQWINCDTKLPIAGETQQNYTPTQNGNYAVVVGKNGCTDTSACKSVTTLSLTSLTKDLMVNVFPNPSNGIFHVVLNRELSNGYVQIMDLTGKEILVLPVEERREMKLELESHGVFLLQLYTDQELVHRELIISK